MTNLTPVFEEWPVVRFFRGQGEMKMSGSGAACSLWELLLHADRDEHPNGITIEHLAYSWLAVKCLASEAWVHHQVSNRWPRCLGRQLREDFEMLILPEIMGLRVDRCLFDESCKPKPVPGGGGLEGAMRLAPPPYESPLYRFWMNRAECIAENPELGFRRALYLDRLLLEGPRVFPVVLGGQEHSWDEVVLGLRRDFYGDPEVFFREGQDLTQVEAGILSKLIKS